MIPYPIWNQLRQTVKRSLLYKPLTIEELDRFVEQADAAFKRSHSEAMTLLSNTQFQLTSNFPKDPFSEKYQQSQMDLYFQVSGRQSYVPETNERGDSDLEKVKLTPYPYLTRNPSAVSEQLVAQGFTISCINLPPPARIVEFGPGWGNLTLELAKTGYDVTAVEIDPTMCDLLRHRSQTLDVPLRIVQSGMLESNLENNFDAVVFFESFHHCSDPLKMIKKVYDLLRPGGLAIFSGEPVMPFPQPWGVRLDGQSVWSIRRYGWLELGFDINFWYHLLDRAGFSVEYRSISTFHLAQVFIARKK